MSTVRTGLAEAGIDFGVFGPSSTTPSANTPKNQTHFASPDARGNAHTSDYAVGEDSDEHGEGEERQARPVIKLRSARHANGRTLSRSRSRRDLSQAAEDDRRPVSPDATDIESVANVRFSAHIIAKTDLSTLMPFALIAPETSKRRPRPESSDSRLLASTQPSEDGHPAGAVPQTPTSSYSVRNPTFLQGPPDDLKGVFVRRFRWGTIDILDPNHCDFAALRTAVLSTHLKVCRVMRP